MPPKGSWTEAEKYRFLLQIVKQLGGQKLSIKYDQLDMPGRTPKALSEMWSKLKKEIEATGAGSSDGDGSEGGASITTPKKATKAANSKPSAKRLKTPKKMTPSKRKAKDSDDELDTDDTPDLHGDTEEDSVDGGVKLDEYEI